MRAILGALFLLFFSLVAFSQVGPMGIGNADGTPTSAGPQPRLLLWLDGSSALPYIISEINSPVNIWNDKSGNGHNFVPVNLGGTTLKPFLNKSGSFSGPPGTSGTPATPALRFRDKHDHLFCADFELTGDGYTIYFVTKTDDENYGLFSYANLPSEREMLIYNDDGNGGIQQQIDNLPARTSQIGDLHPLPPVPGPSIVNGWNYGGITWSNANDDNWEFEKGDFHQGGFGNFTNESFSGTGTAMIGDIQNAGNMFPIFSDTPLPTNFDGYIAEIIVFEGRISRPATRLLTTYLWVKYGLEGNSSGWDKYHGIGYTGAGAAWGGKYYAPIGIGNDIVTPNAGSVNEARSAGLVLRVNQGEWTQTRSYLCAAPVGNSITGLTLNTIVTDDVGGILTPTVLNRWSRLWEIAGNSEGNNQVFEIAFDFPEGIDGDIPQNPENFVLLYRDDPDAGDFSILPVENTNKFVLDNELVFWVSKSALITPNRYYTIGTTDASSSLTGDIKRTWYAYQSGNWSDTLTWTLDGSASPTYVNPGGDTPNIFDDVFIGSGRSVTVDMSLPNYASLKVFGTLDVASAAQPSFLTIAGSGLIRCSAGNFPTGNSTAFADPIIGGTLEFYGAGGFTQATDLVVNKLKVNLSNTAATMTLDANLTSNGLFEVNNGTFILNSTDELIVTSNARVLVESSGKILVTDAAGNQKHDWYFYNDLINDGGEVRFTTRDAANYAAYTTNFANFNANETQDIITAYFSSGSNNQELRANGTSNFSRIVVDKGVDITYILSISSTDSEYFKLLGRCNDAMGEINYADESDNQNSFALINGTAEINENIFIPLLINNGYYSINFTAQLWVNGGVVTKGRLGGTGNTSAIVLYGYIKVSAGILNVLTSDGIVIRDNGVVQVDDQGTVNANQIRTSLLGTSNIGGLVINGGTVNIDGNRPEGSNNNYYTLSLTYPGNLFQMTGGTLNITGPTSRGLVFINSDPQNTSVTGGTVNLDVSDTQNTYKISSRAAFWDLTLTRSSTSSTIRSFKIVGGTSAPTAISGTIADQDLIVRNNLSITGSNTRLQMGTSTTPADLYLTGNLNIGSGCVYIHNRNTTHFVGSSNSSLTFGGATTFPFFNVEVNKDFDSRFATIQQTGPNPAMDILGSLNLEKGYFDNNNRRVEVRGNITNRSQFGDVGSASITMTGTSGRQEIISDEGVFYYLRINNADGVALKNDGITVKTRLTLDAGSFFIGDNKLRLETTNATPIASFNGTDKFVVCSGNASAGGVEILNHSATQYLAYPIGVTTGSGQKYTFAQIYVNSGWMDDGFVRVTPVDTLLSTSDLSGTADYLNYYWKVSSTDYVTKPNVSHRFKYDEADVRGTETNFESGRVLSDLPFMRSFDNAPASAHVNTGSNLIYYNGTDQSQGVNGTGTPLVNADYSAGAADRFPIGSTPDIFFSNSATVGAAWETPANWSTCVSCTDPYVYHSTSAPVATDFPASGDIAVIGFNVNSGGKPHVYRVPPSGGIKAAQVIFTPLQDNGGVRQPRYNGGAFAELGILRPTLQISNTNDIINVTQISGEGALWLEGDIDLGVTDLGGFLSEDSSVVVINTGDVVPVTSNFLPPVVPNLFLAFTNTAITSDIRIRGNLEVAGASRLLLSETLKGNIEINGDLILDEYQLSSGDPTVLFNKRGTLKTIEVHGDVKLLGTSAQIGINTIAGPAVPPVPWTPDVIGAFLWLDAADTSTVTTSGSKVTGWNNKAGGPFNAVQLDPTKQPDYQVSAVLNDSNTIRFDGIDDFLSIPHSVNLNLLANQDFEIFAVTQIDNYNGVGPDGYPVIYGKGKTSTKDFLMYVAINTFRLYMDANQFAIQAPNTAGTAPNLGWIRRQGVSGALYNTIGGNSTKGNVSNATNLGNTHNVTIGAAEDGTLRFLDGDIGEIILIKRTLTNDERQQMEGYLAHKWGLEGDLPVGHPYKDDAPLIGGNDNTAQLIVDGDIIQNLSSTASLNNGVELYKTGADTAFVNLVVTSAGANEFNNINGPTPRLWKLRVDKGINTTSSFTFNTDVNIDGPANQPEKPVDIRNGLVKFDDSNIDITLSSGGGDFVIPNSGGLELNNGDLNITGVETGLLLSGSLNITGGSLTIADTDTVRNNYIEYGGGGSPKINISGGTLIVGSQIRRNLSSTGGALDYRQSGGDVILGRYSAPELSRGVLEVVNAGSRFDHTGGTLTFVRGVTLGSTPSLLLTPATSNVSGASEIIIGNADSPSGGAIQNFGIKSSIALNALTINTTNSPVVHLITNDLELNGDLTIQAGATLNCDDRNLLLHQDVTNAVDGLLSSTSGTVSLIHSVNATVAGSGVYDLYDLERRGSGQTLVQTDLLVKNNFSNDEGEMDFQGNTLTVKGNVTTDGILKFDTGSNGLIFSGTDPQILQRTYDGISEIDVMTITNEFGVTIPQGFSEFIINKNLRLENGILSLSGNLLEMADGSAFTAVNPFGERNMIVTGGAFTNFGIRLHIPANTTDDIFIPLGVDRYMPVNLDFAQPGYSSGTTASTYLLRLNIPENGVVIQADEDSLLTPECTTQIDDLNNVLGMYFTVDGTNIGDGLNVDIKFRYDNQYVQVTSPNTEADYIAARVLANSTTIQKLGTGAVDEVNDILTFNIQGDFAGAGSDIAVDGDYFAGIDCAIPNTILTYIVEPNFWQVEQGASGNDPLAYDVAVPGGGAPSGALVIVPSGSFLSFKNLNGVNFYRTEIQAGAFVLIDRTSQHRLGRVTGEGTLWLIGIGNLPAGDYTGFFGCNGGKLTYQADGPVSFPVPRPADNFEVLSNMPPIEEVNLRGNGLGNGGTITIADNAVNICNNLIVNFTADVKAANSAILTVGGDLLIESGDFDFRQGSTFVQRDIIVSGSSAAGGTIISGNNGNVTVERDLTIGGRGFDLGTVFRETHVEGNVSKTTNPAAGSIKQGTGGAKLVFDGIVPQTITGDFIGTSKIPFIELNNVASLTLNGNVDVSDTLKLTDGNIFTSTGNILKLTEDGTDVDPNGGQPNSFVDGPMQWTLSNTAPERKFPVGNNDRYRPLSISNRSASRTWEVEYRDTLARDVLPIDPFMLPDPTNVPTIETVSLQEFWRVDSRTPTSTNANVRLSWGDSSAVSTNPSDQSNLLVLGYNEGTDVWDSYGGMGFQYDAPTNRGNFISVDQVTFTERFLTLGSSDELNPLPVSWLFFEGETDGVVHTLTWATASELNNSHFVLERSIDAKNWSKIAEIEGAGNSTQRLDYSFKDRMAPQGRSYYRIKQVDYDFMEEYAPEVVSLLRSQSAGMGTDEIRLFPNPNRIGNVRILIPALGDVNVKMSISDMNGRLIDQSIISFNNQGISESVNCQYAPGLYIISIYNETGVWSAKLVVSP